MTNFSFYVDSNGGPDSMIKMETITLISQHDSKRVCNAFVKDHLAELSVTMPPSDLAMVDGIRCLTTTELGKLPITQDAKQFFSARAAMERRAR